MDINAIRTALATNLGGVPGLRTAALIPDLVNPPIGIFTLSSIDYNGAMKNGLTTLSFQLTVIVTRVSDRTSQTLIDSYLAPTGTYSVKASVESNRTLGGLVYDLRVEAMTNIGSITANDQEYLAAEFTVTVYA